MAAGLPVVATNVGDVTNIVEHGKNGFVVEKMNYMEMVRSIEKIVSSHKTQKAFSERGRDVASRRWRPEVIAEKHLDMYEDELSR